MYEPTLSPITGLSEDEAQRRRHQGQGNDAQVKTGRSYARIVRDNVFTFFNIVLFALALTLLVLGSPRDALFTGAIALVNAVIATAQEIRAKRKLDAIALLTRPQATVMRSGAERTIDPAKIVLGDLVVAGPGDQILVDGVVVGDGAADVDESLLTGEADAIPKQAGDAVLSGSFVVSGKVMYTAQKVGAESFANQLAAGARQFSHQLTPLQREVNLVVRILLLLVLYFGALITLNYFSAHGGTLLESVQSASVVFGLAPSSLFLMIVVAYALGAIRIADKGALVQQSNAIESLCHVDVLCLDKTGTLTANRIRLERVTPLNGCTESTVRRLLGIYARSVPAANATAEAIAAACDGVAQAPSASVPFSSARKWSALAFDAPAVAGVYVLGAPEMLQPALNGDVSWEEEARIWADAGHRILLFATAPTDNFAVRVGEGGDLPASLTPLALLTFTDELRPDARQTLAGFRQAGVAVKIISGDNPQTVAALARQAGLADEDVLLRLATGPALAALDDTAFAAAVAETDIFGRITPAQKQRIVRTLRDQGHYVGMTGDGVNDVLALKQANLSIAMQSGTPATRNVADIVLLNDAFAALPAALLEGQRIMHGMEDTLRLYLTRIFTLAILIATIAMLEVGFPYTPAQNSVISIFSLTIPAFFLALWAPTGAVPHGTLVRKLLNFVLPATVVTAIFAIAIYLLFMGMTQDWGYTQLVLTYMSIAMGLLLVIFVQPPTEFWVGGDRLANDRRPALLATTLLILMMSSPYVPILRDFFGLDPLRAPLDVVTLAGATLAWMFVLRVTWKRRIIDRYLDVDLTDGGAPR
ncbi:MAG TPA: haloacid dehalogenase [Chloroflexi bacterium]|nr:haloacid dehalogenase [Chloroflexota bacterium]HHW88427.1 HAD-IC family P-type ATPase [Chloroflexota bacterium]